MNIKERIERVQHFLTADQRQLPGFLIIGAQKAGTSSLYHYLAQHPHLSPSYFKKEINFFEQRYGKKSLKWYQSHFELTKPGQLTFEASTNYLPFPWAPERITKQFPGIKVIVLLRNPIERAWSQHKHQIRSNEETLDFQGAIDRELSQMDKVETDLLSDPTGFSKFYRNYSYLRRGLYYQQIQNWLKFVKREQIYITTADDFFSDPEKICTEIFDFLGVEPCELNVGKAYNQGDGKSDIPEDTLEFLRGYFEPHNKKIYEFLGRDLGWDS